MVAIDGCSVGCIRAILEHAAVPLQSYVVLTELGFEKNMNSTLDKADIEKVKQAVRSSMKSDPGPGGNQSVPGRV